MNKKILLSSLIGSVLFISANANAEEVKQEKEKNSKALVSLSSTVNNEVLADEMTIITKYSVSAKTSEEVKLKITESMNAAKEKLKALPSGDLEYQFNNVSIHPVYYYGDPKDGSNNEAKITSWRGVATLKIISKDRNFSNASNAAIQLNNFVIEDVTFSLSKEEIKKYEDVMVKNAINDFKQKANLISNTFDYSGYNVIDVAVSFNNEINYIQPRNYAPRAVMLKAELNDAGQQSPTMDFTPNKIDLSASVQGRIELIK